jgi:hypothetical protein
MMEACACRRSLHLPDQGTFRSYFQRGREDWRLGYDALRYPEGQQAGDYVKVTFPAASAARHRARLHIGSRGHLSWRRRNLSETPVLTAFAATG